MSPPPLPPSFKWLKPCARCVVSTLWLTWQSLLSSQTLATTLRHGRLLMTTLLTQQTWQRVVSEKQGEVSVTADAVHVKPASCPTDHAAYAQATPISRARLHGSCSMQATRCRVKPMDEKSSWTATTQRKFSKKKRDDSGASDTCTLKVLPVQLDRQHPIWALCSEGSRRHGE